MKILLLSINCIQLKNLFSPRELVLVIVLIQLNFLAYSKPAYLNYSTFSTSFERIDNNQVISKEIQRKDQRENPAPNQDCVQSPTGMVSWWSGDENAEDVIGSNNGTFQNGASLTEGMVGQAFLLDGVADFVEIPDAPSLDIGTGDFSIDAWVRTSADYEELQIIMDKRYGSVGDTPTLGYHFFVGSSGLGFQLNDRTKGINYDSWVYIQDGLFHHVAVTVQRKSPVGGKLYVDGKVALIFDPTPFMGNLDNTANFRIGASTVEGQYPNNSFEGVIDEFGLYKRALTNGEISSIFEAGSRGKCKVSNFMLINADTNKEIKKLKNKDTLNLVALSSVNINIGYNIFSSKPGSVVFQLSGEQTRIHTENSAPFALYGNKQNDYSGWTPPSGNYTLTATPYELKDGKGKKGTPLTIHFQVIYQVVDSLILVNVETDEDIKTLENGEVIDLSTLPTTKLNIRAVVYPAKVGSVVFNLNNKLMVQESYVPYAIGGDIKGNFRAWTLPTGKNTLIATPYELENGTGQKGQAYTVNFTVVDPLGMARARAANHQQNSVTDTKSVQVNLNAQPNPFTSSTTIHFSVPQTGYTTVQLYNNTGAMLEHLYGAVAEAKVVNKLSLQSKELPSGMYMLRLTSVNQAQSFKLLLIR